MNTSTTFVYLFLFEIQASESFNFMLRHIWNSCITIFRKILSWKIIIEFKNWAKQDSLRYSFFTVLYYRGTFGILIYITWKCFSWQDACNIFVDIYFRLKGCFIDSCYIFLQSVKFLLIFIGKKFVSLVLPITFSSLWG